jgi:dephospho-CoA kinase
LKKYNNSLIVAVTGGIGSGQSTVCSFFSKWGCKIIDADRTAKQVIMKNKKVQKELIRTFGREIFDRNYKLNKSALAEIAFRNEMETQKLNKIVHPHMVELLIEGMEKARFSKKYPLVLVDAALIYEVSIEQMFDFVVVVDAPYINRMQRVKKRDDMNRRQFNERLSKQIPLKEKVAWADYVIQNDADLDTLMSRTKYVFNELSKKAS